MFAISRSGGTPMYVPDTRRGVSRADIARGARRAELPRVLAGLTSEGIGAASEAPESAASCL